MASLKNKKSSKLFLEAKKLCMAKDTKKGYKEEENL